MMKINKFLMILFLVFTFATSSMTFAGDIDYPVPCAIEVQDNY